MPSSGFLIDLRLHSLTLSSAFFSHPLASTKLSSIHLTENVYMGITGDVLLMLCTLLLVSLFLHVLDRCILKLFMVFHSNNVVRMKITHKPFSSTISNWECSNNSQVFSIHFHSVLFIWVYDSTSHSCTFSFHCSIILLSLVRKKLCFQSVLS